MSQLTMYQVSVPMMVRMLQNLAAILRKGQEHARAEGLPERDLIEARLAEDMFPLARQVQIASDAAKGAGARLAGVEVPAFEDREQSFDELQQRVAKTVAFLEGLKPEQLDGSEAREVRFATRAGEHVFADGQAYLAQFALPNFFFHVTTAYDILRHKGVPLGKLDYLQGGQPR